MTLRHTTLGRTLPDGRPTRRRNLYQKTHNTHKKQTFVFPAGFEPAVPASERLQGSADGYIVLTSVLKEDRLL